MPSRFPCALALVPLLISLVVACSPDDGPPAPTAPATAAAVSGLQHYIFFNLDRERIREASFVENPSVAGAQLKYTWRELEPERDRYAFRPLLDDLAFLEAHGKRLWVQLQDVSFDERVNVPDYLLEDPEFNGGANRKYEYDEERKVAKFDGWVARRWDPAVIDRLGRLLRALGDEVDGRIEGVSLAETSVGFGRGEETRPAGYSLDAYATGIKAIMSAAGEVFPRSEVIQYANFMPGEWLPWDDKGYLRGVYEHAAIAGVGVGGPDLMPFRKGQQNHCQRFIRERSADTVAGLAVQWGNLEEIDPETGRPVTVERLHRFAEDELALDYIFWGTQEPFYSEAILPYLSRLGA
jgi:hypothetical protein